MFAFIEMKKMEKWSCTRYTLSCVMQNKKKITGRLKLVCESLIFLHLKILQGSIQAVCEQQMLYSFIAYAQAYLSLSSAHIR